MPAKSNTDNNSEYIQITSSASLNNDNRWSTRFATGALSVLMLCSSGIGSFHPFLPFDTPAPYAITLNNEDYNMNDLANNAYNINNFFSTGCVDMATKAENLALLNSFYSLGENWDFYGAHPFAPTLIQRAIALIFQLKQQPNIFPTARDSIQFEYTKENGDYLEFEMFLSGDIKAFSMLHSGETTVINDISFYEPQRINRVVSDFYGETIS